MEERERGGGAYYRHAHYERHVSVACPCRPILSLSLFRIYLGNVPLLLLLFLRLLALVVVLLLARGSCQRM